MALELEINAATRAFLPEGSMEFATPLQRVELKASPDSELKVIIGQLLPVVLNKSLSKHSYILVCRLLSSEKDSNLIVDLTRKNSSQSLLMTFDEACERSLEEDFHAAYIEEFWCPWIPPQSSNLKGILFKANLVENQQDIEGGRIYRLSQSEYVTFQWSHPDSDSLLDISNEQFNKTALELYTNKQSELFFASRWLDLTYSERDEVAFACKNGDWSVLRQIATLVLKFRLGQEANLSEDEFIWDFTNYGATSVNSTNFDWSLWNDDFLFEWRRILVQHFEPNYVDEAGVKEEIPYCVDEHIYESKLDKIVSTKPSQHEVLEAGLQLSKWAKENLSASAEEFKKLMDF